MRKYSLLLMLGFFCVCLAGGCAGKAKTWNAAMPWGEKPSQIAVGKYPAPVKMVALWSPAMLNTPGKQATRGFGGRLYFYNAKNEPVPVQGQLVVYCFDDTNKTSDHTQADRRVGFTPEQFSGHFSPTELGASYSIWVPWDAIGNPQTEISLVPIFTAATGQVVVGQQSLGLLPGPETPLQEKRVEEQVLSAKARQEGNIARVGFDEDISAGRGQSRIRTTSITLPQGLAERVAASRNLEPQRLPQEAGRDAQSAVENTSRPTNAQAPPQGTTEAMSGFRGYSTENSPPPRQAQKPGRLTHSERSRPQVPALQPPRPLPGPAPTQPPPSEWPSSLP